MKQFAKATWEGSGLEGGGCLTVQSQTILRAPYTFNSRFNAADGTNSEELLAAAHASDFTMKLSFILTEAGYTPRELITTCYIHFDRGQIVSSTIELRADVPGVSKSLFDEYVDEANSLCPVSRILNIKIIIESSLIADKNQPPGTGDAIN